MDYRGSADSVDHQGDEVASMGSYALLLAIMHTVRELERSVQE